MLKDYVAFEQEMDEIFSGGYDGMEKIKSYYELRDKVNAIRLFVVGLMALEEEDKVK